MKLSEFKTLFGVKGDALSLSSWWQLILGVVVSFLAVGIGQGIYQRVAGSAPVRKLGGDNIEPFTKAPVAVSNPYGEVL